MIETSNNTNHPGKRFARRCLTALAYSLSAALLAGCVPRAEQRLPEPDEEFGSVGEYQEWAFDEGYERGALVDEGAVGINHDRFFTRPGMPGYDSGRIVIGDSRCCQLGIYAQRAGADGYAVFAAWGGHYTPSQPFLPTEEFYAEVEACFRKQISSRGVCELFFFATVNDYESSGEGNAESIASAVACAERLASMKCEHGGSEVSPIVTVIGIAGVRTEGEPMYYDPAVFNRRIDEYNEALRQALGQSPVLRDTLPRYTTVPELTNGEPGFIDDGLHYDDGTLRILAEFICGKQRPAERN